jgi:hypothetical protein
MGSDFQPSPSCTSPSLRILLGIAAVFELPTLVYFLSSSGSSP